MELNQALKIVLDLAEQNMFNDDDMFSEMKQQMDAIENVRLHMQELENPSPIQVVLIGNGMYFQKAYANVPIELTALDEDIEGWGEGKGQLFQTLDSKEYYPLREVVTTDPQIVADILCEFST